jgi:hypothetical protein
VTLRNISSSFIRFFPVFLFLLLVSIVFSGCPAREEWEDAVRREAQMATAINRQREEIREAKGLLHENRSRLKEKDGEVQSLKEKLLEQKDRIRKLEGRIVASGEANRERVQSLERAVEGLKRDQAEGRRQLESYEKIIDTLRRYTPLSNLHNPDVPKINGKILAIKKVNPTLLLLSVGAAQKVKKGYEFTVYRGREYIGKVVIEDVREEMAGARLIYLKSGETIREGDPVTTRVD